MRVLTQVSANLEYLTPTFSIPRSQRGSTQLQVVLTNLWIERPLWDTLRHLNMEGTPILVRLSFQARVQERKKIIKIAFSLERTPLELSGSKDLVSIVAMIMRIRNLSLTPGQSGSNSSRKSIPSKRRKGRNPTKLRWHLSTSMRWRIATPTRYLGTLREKRTSFSISPRKLKALQRSSQSLPRTRNNPLRKMSKMTRY